jgi:ABC-type glycerol-3-phosphate transport system substrate-binding protein
MKPVRTLVASAALAALSTFAFGGAARAACQVDGKGEVDVITNFFPTLELLAKKMKECERPDLKIEVKMTTSVKSEIPRAFEAAKSPFDGAHVANSSVTQLQAKGQLMKLNPFVDKYKDKYKIEDQMLIRFGEEVVAVAFMANAQILFFRKDILEKHKIAVPKSYDELLAACETIRKNEPDIDHCFSAAYGNAWELGNEFVDIYLAMGGQLTDPATAEPAFTGEAGLKTLELMKKLFAQMSPNALAIDFGGVKQELQQGRTAMAFLWGDTAPAMDNPSESKVVGKVGFAPAPAAKPGGPIATLFWWDGYVIPKNLDGDPDLTFRVMMEAIKPETVTENNDITLWLRSNYKPTPYSQAIVDTVGAGAQPFPMSPQVDLSLLALGESTSNFLAGKVSAQQSLDDAAKAYRRAAKDAGFLR